jgi:hypothetical protein
MHLPSGVYSISQIMERSNTEEYWRKTIAEEIRQASSVDEAIAIVSKCYNN